LGGIVYAIRQGTNGFQITMKAANHYYGHQAVPSDLTLGIKAIESLLVEKRLVQRWE
jgi:hypothetical protein